MSTTGMGTSFGGGGVEGVEVVEALGVGVDVDVVEVVCVDVCKEVAGISAILLSGVLGNQTRTPISASMARWRSSNSKRVSTFWSSVMARV
jgi:hypothetical protein